MSSTAKIAYNDLIRGLNGQAADLESIRSHVNIALSAGGVAAAFLLGQSSTNGWLIGVAVGAFGMIALVAGYSYFSVRAFVYDFVGRELVANYVDRASSPDEMLRELVILGEQGYKKNRVELNRRWLAHNLALAAFILEIVALLVHFSFD